MQCAIFGSVEGFLAFLNSGKKIAFLRSNGRFFTSGEEVKQVLLELPLEDKDVTWTNGTWVVNHQDVHIQCNYDLRI
jgi:hypothetical protein